MTTSRKFTKKAIGTALIAIYGMAHFPLLQATPTIIHTEPLASAGNSVAPNLMFILDDSGSMAQDYTPDYVQNVGLCRDRGDDLNLDACDIGDPPFSSSSFNFQYYNPAITYLPGYDPTLPAPAAIPSYLGRSNMVNYNDATKWAVAERDPYSSNNPTGTTDLIVGNTDVVYCNESGPTQAEKFDTAKCKDPVDTGVTPTAEASGTGVWRYPNPRRTSNTVNFENRVSRTGTATNPVPPYFYSISQVLFCVNRNGATAALQHADERTASKTRFGKGSTTDATNKCNTRRFNDGTNNFQWPRFGLIPYNVNSDTQTFNRQEASNSAGAATDNDARRWEGMSGFQRHNIVDIGSGVLPANYPSRANPAVYTNRPDCGDVKGFGPCTYTQEMTNYANWFVYYSNRLKMMKTAAGLAFFDVDDKFRVGFITINPMAGSPASVQASKYLQLHAFDTTHKTSWYAKFYAQNAASGTPLREALSRVGRHYAGKTDRINNGMGFAADSLNALGVADSVIASCQKNFALLTTDGYWTTASSALDSTANTGWKIDGTTRMDDQDDGASVLRPFNDGSGVQSSAAATSIGTLADVAMYYYKTDLRPPVLVGVEDVWEDNVRSTGADTAVHQHMTTFTLGLGLEGILNYQSNYNSTPPPAGDYKAIVDGTKNWPVPTAAGNDEKALDDLWHAAVNGRGKFFSARDPNALASGLAEALGSIQAETGAGAAAATSNLQPVAGDNWAFTAEYQTVSWNGDVKARTIDLVGGIISPVHLWSASAKLDQHSAAARSIYTFTSDTVNFPSKVKAFTWTDAASTAYPSATNLTTAEQAFFNPAQLTGPNGWNGTQVAAATAKSVVDFVRGDRSKEDTGENLDTDLYRPRLHVLGDIVTAQPVYIKVPPFSYTDNGYAAFREANLGRRGTLYVASNDGMLHAFETDPDGRPYYQINGITSATDRSQDTFSDAAPDFGTNDGGTERWAFIPTRVMSNLYKLATTNYQHRWYVDGTPLVEDYCVTTATGTGSTTTAAHTCPGQSAWKTILVGGLNGGGRGFYALDITDPLNPKGLWEFNARDPSVTACAATTGAAIGEASDCDLGLSFSNPIITKLPLGHASSGKWVVLLASGYDNYKTVDGAAANTAGDGNGYLYILDVLTGRIIEKIKTCTGTPGTAAATPPYSDADPCGFTKINTFHPLKNGHIDNSPVRVYGTTVKGEIWRVDLTQQLSPRVFLLATLKDPVGAAQPITTPPEFFLPTGLDQVGYANPWEAPAAVFVATGRYLGIPDRSDPQRQSIYAIKDIPATSTTLANARGSLQERFFTSETTDATGLTKRNMTGGTKTAFTASNGWFADFPLDAASSLTGERVNVEFQIIATTLVIASNIPKVNSCVAGGTSWLNFIDVNTGSAVTGLTVPFTSIKLTSSLIVGISPIQLGDKIKTIVTTADNQQLTFDTPISGNDFSGQRLQWRELTQ